MLRSSYALSARRHATRTRSRTKLSLYVETLEDRRLLSTNSLTDADYALLIAYFQAGGPLGDDPYRTLESLLNGDIEPLLECPGLREEFCLPDTVSSPSVDEAMGSNVGLDDDWFSIDESKRDLLDTGGLKERTHYDR